MNSRLILGILLVHFASTAAMFGVIWQVQLITYPQFSSVESVSFAEFHRDYCQRITWIVGPLMILELGSSSFSVLALWNTRWKIGSLVALSLVISMWGVTALVQVPQHEHLSLGFDAEVARELVSGNGYRVLGWTIHLAVISRILYGWCHERTISPGRENQ